MLQTMGAHRVAKSSAPLVYLTAVHTEHTLKLTLSVIFRTLPSLLWEKMVPIDCISCETLIVV